MENYPLNISSSIENINGNVGNASDITIQIYNVIQKYISDTKDPINHQDELGTFFILAQFQIRFTKKIMTKKILRKKINPFYSKIVEMLKSRYFFDLSKIIDGSTEAYTIIFKNSAPNKPVIPGIFLIPVNMPSFVTEAIDAVFTNNLDFLRNKFRSKDDFLTTSFISF